jgi:amino acid transporter
MANNDAQDLGRFGYAQELFRSMGGFSNFAISFSTISILTGVGTLYGYGLEMGGPLQMTLGWPIVTLFTLTIAASMAELSSAYPTSGAMYHWASALGGTATGWFVAWLNIVGAVAAVAGINYSCAQFMLPFLDLPATAGNTFALFALTLLVQGMLNQYGVGLVAKLNDVSVVVHIAGVIVIVGCVFWMAPTQPASFLLQAVNSNGRSPYAWAFLLGLLQAQWTYTGYDASAHMAEETSDPRRVVPWGIVMAVAVAGVSGYALILALTFGISTIPEVLGAKDAGGNPIPAAIAILQSALGAKLGNTMAALVSMAMWFCGLASVTSASRTVYSLARDNGVPFASFFKRVDPKHGTPGPAIWATVGASLAAMAWSGIIPIVTSLSTVALYLAYIIPIVLGYRARKEWTGMAVWSLGKWGPAVNLVAIVYGSGACLILMMPPNELAGETLSGVLLVLVAIYFGVVRRVYKGPEWVEQD